MNKRSSGLAFMDINSADSYSIGFYEELEPRHMRYTLPKQPPRAAWEIAQMRQVMDFCEEYLRAEWPSVIEEFGYEDSFAMRAVVTTHLWGMAELICEAPEALGMQEMAPFVTAYTNDMREIKAEREADRTKREADRMKREARASPDEEEAPETLGSMCFRVRKVKEQE